MKKLLSTILICLILATTVSGQFFNSRMKPRLGLRVNPYHPLGTKGGLVGCWFMNENAGTITFDLSGNGNNGTILTDTVWDSGQYGSALLFDGSDGGVNCGNNSSLDITGDMTIVFSFNPDDVSTVKRIIHKNDAYGLWVTQGRLQLYNYADATSALSLNSLTVNEQQHIAVVKRGAVVNFYRNFINIDDDTTITATLATSAINLYIGIDEDGTSFPYDGHLDYVYIYNRAFSLSERAQLYQNSFCFMEPSWNWILYGGISVPTGAGQVIFIN